MQWIWDVKKNEHNKRKHGWGFETAQLVFDDPLAKTQSNSTPDEERWETLGMIGHTIVFVVHTWPDNQIGRIISARKATTCERKLYEEENNL